MPREFLRKDRVAETITRRLSMIFREQISDPRISSLTITEVEVTKDLRQAKVFVTELGEAHQQADILAALDRASGFIRKNLAADLDMRFCPTLVFKYDDAIAESARMSALIDKALNKN